MVEPESGRVPDRGQAIPVLLMVVAVTAVMAVGVAAWGVRLSARARVESAADAAALAGVVYGLDAARAIAAANGAEVVGWQWDDPRADVSTGRVLTVTVSASGSFGDLTARARASTRP
ncbi:MAG: hypothetical protein ACO3C1_05050 [Ilumatobacteraceae bacterium]